MVKGNEFASHCVVGVDDVGQLEAIVAAWASAPVLRDPALAVDDPVVVDPRHWPKRT
jgi:NaMN:DMB phosphoribosyltransferase